MTENEVYMTENEALEILNNECEDISKVQIALKIAREVLEEIQQYRAIGTVDECAEMQVQYNYLSTKIKKYEAIGTVEEVKEAKEQFDNINSCANSVALCGLCDFETAKQSVISTIKATKDEAKCDGCAGCTVWKCDDANIRAKAIDEFVKLADECSGYTANCIEHDLALTIYTIHQIAEQLKAGGIDG